MVSKCVKIVRTRRINVFVLDSNILEVVDSTEKYVSDEFLKMKGATKLNSLSAMELPPLYFHLDDLSIQVTDMQMTCNEPVTEESNLDVLGHRMTPVVSFLWAEVRGRVKAGLGNNIPDKVEFSLVQERLKGKGVVSLTVDLRNVTWSYINFTPEYSSFQIKNSQDEVDSRVYMRLNSTKFGELLSSKLQRSINHQLSKVATKIIMESLRRSSKLKALQQYNEEISTIGINNTENANTFIDSILKVGGAMIKNKFGDQIKIPDINEGFATKVIVTFRGSFRATGGSAIGISSVYRIGDVVFGYDNESLLHFYGVLGFQELHLYYGHYKAEMWGVGPSGSLDTSLVPVKVLAHVHLNTSSKMISLHKFKIIEVGDLRVSLTGLGGMMDWLVSRVSTWVVGMYRDQVLQLLEAQYEQYARDVFSTYTLEELLDGGTNENFVLK